MSSSSTRRATHRVGPPRYLCQGILLHALRSSEFARSVRPDRKIACFTTRKETPVARAAASAIFGLIKPKNGSQRDPSSSR
jgi:hypothetical protein